MRCIRKVGIMSDIGKVGKNLAVPGVMNEGYLYDRTPWSEKHQKRERTPGFPCLKTVKTSRHSIFSGSIVRICNYSLFSILRPKQMT